METKVDGPMPNPAITNKLNDISEQLDLLISRGVTISNKIDKLDHSPEEMENGSSVKEANKPNTVLEKVWDISNRIEGASLQALKNIQRLDNLL